MLTTSHSVLLFSPSRIEVLNCVVVLVLLLLASFLFLFTVRYVILALYLLVFIGVSNMIHENLVGTMLGPPERQPGTIPPPSPSLLQAPVYEYVSMFCSVL